MEFQSTRRTFLTAAAAAGASIGLPTLALAQSFPEKGKPIRGYVTFSPGSAVNVVARAYAQAMGETLGTTIVIDNRAGADGVIGEREAKDAKPDGYSLLFTSLSTQVMNPHLYKEIPYDPLKDFVPLAGTMKSTLMMGVGPSIKHKTAAEFFAAAKANPGKYTYASVSATTRLAGNMLGRAAGIDIVNIPYKNFGDLISNWLAGKIDILMADGPSINPYLSQGVRVLGACSLTRSPFYPDVPTLQEQGLKGFEIYGWHAAFAPAKTPPEAVAALRDAIAKAWRSKYVTDLFKKMSVEPLELVGDALAEYQRKDFDRWGAAIREAGMTGTL